MSRDTVTAKVAIEQVRKAFEINKSQIKGLPPGTAEIELKEYVKSLGSDFFESLKFQKPFFSTSKEAAKFVTLYKNFVVSEGGSCDPEVTEISADLFTIVLV